jgi:hypothetical protein
MNRVWALPVVLAVVIGVSSSAAGDEAALRRLVERSQTIVQADVKVSGESEEAGIRWKLTCTVFGTLKKGAGDTVPAVITFEHLQRITSEEESLREPLPFPIDTNGQYILLLHKPDKDGPLAFIDPHLGALPAAKGTARKIHALAGQ